ncbi:sulfotransferase [Salinisphaera sp. T31B1]|uniref:sulfotransferase n=1 Tax=Salinisphaera sp. T31B1 TaxID=727963 RepID=UPI00333F285F
MNPLHARRTAKLGFLRRMVSPRRTHAYCVGTAKSGTHSINAFIKPPLTAAHELESERTIETIIARRDGQLSDRQLDRFLLKRDRRHRLDVDSSQLNFFFLDELVRLFPRARFILTVREPRAWLDSFVNHQLGRSASSNWQRLRDLRFRPDVFPHGPDDAVFAEHGLYSLDGYLSYWREHNLKVLEAVPADRLMVLKTRHIGDSIAGIAQFLNVDPELLDAERAHAFTAATKFGLLESLDERYLNDRIRDFTADVMLELERRCVSPSVAQS